MLIDFDRTVVGPSSSGLLQYQRLGARSGTCYLTCHGKDHNPANYGPTASPGTLLPTGSFSGHNRRGVMSPPVTSQWDGWILTRRSFLSLSALLGSAFELMIPPVGQAKELFTSKLGIITDELTEDFARRRRDAVVPAQETLAVVVGR